MSERNPIIDAADDPRTELDPAIAIPDDAGDPMSELDPDVHARPASAEANGVLGDSSAHEAAVEEVEEDLARSDEPGTSGGDEERPPGEAELAAAALSRRTELLSPVTTRLARALKRALQDDQNELLDSIRHASAPAGLDSLLPAEAHRLRYEQAATLALSDAWTVGRLFVTSEEEGDAASGRAEKLALMAEEAGRELGAQLAAELTGLLRHRLSDSLANAGGIGGAAHDITGASYREWKGPRIEAVAGDFTDRGVLQGRGGRRRGNALAVGRRRRRPAVPGLRRQLARRPAGGRGAVPHWSAASTSPFRLSLPAGPCGRFMRTR